MKIRKRSGKFVVAVKKSIATCFMPMIYVYTRILEHIFPIMIHSEEFTLQKVIEGGSISRIGDGELDIALGHDNEHWFQDFNESLAYRLREIMALDMDTTPGFYVALLPYLNSHGCKEYKDRSYVRRWDSWNATRIPTLYRMICKGQTYYNALCFRPSLREESYEDIEQRISKIKRIWEGKRILIAEGGLIAGGRADGRTRSVESCMGVGNDLLAGAESVQRIIVPPINAFAKYDEILETICRCYNHDLVLLIMGMTASVLAYDLYRRGIRAIDFGQSQRIYVEMLKELHRETGEIITKEQWEEQIIERLD